MGMLTKKESGRRNGHLSWDFPTSDEDDELDLFTEGQLTGLVRSSYLRYLERCLAKNCEECHAHELGERESLLKSIAHHARLLERKALRACMQVGIYQRVMVQIMEEVKKSTRNHAPFVDFRNGQNVPQVDQETQTDFVEEKPTKQDELAVFLNAFGLNPNDPDSRKESAELLNILMSPQDKSSGETRAFPLQTKAIAQQTRPMNLDERLHALGLIADDDSPAPPFCPDSAVAAAFDEDKSIQPSTDSPISRFPSSSWSEDLIFQTASLNRILSRLSPFQVAMIEKRFRDLFGSESHDLKMNDEQKAVCRKRMANLVVAGLTPYYLQKRIASKELFKHLAKTVTDKLMSRANAPDLATVKKEIKLIFFNKKEFCTLKDVDL